MTTESTELASPKFEPVGSCLQMFVSSSRPLGLRGGTGFSNILTPLESNNCQDGSALASYHDVSLRVDFEVEGRLRKLSFGRPLAPLTARSARSCPQAAIYFRTASTKMASGLHSGYPNTGHAGGRIPHIHCTPRKAFLATPCTTRRFSVSQSV